MEDSEAEPARNVGGHGVESTTPSIDELFAAISDARRALDDAVTPDQKVIHRSRLDSLRAQIASHPDTGLKALPLEHLERRIVRLERRLDSVYDARLSPDLSAGPTEAGGGIHPAEWAEHNRRVDRAHGRADIEAELSRLLAERNRRRPAQTRRRGSNRRRTSVVIDLVEDPRH